MTRPGLLLRRAMAFALVPFAAAATFALWPDAGEAQSARDEHAALFPVCTGASRVTCVVDGDTIWYRGTKIRIADIDTPEVSQPRCPEERALGLAATRRLRPPTFSNI